MKRTTVHVFNAGDFSVALSVCKFLKHHGVDAVVVTKHAVQIHPNHEQQTTEVIPAWRWGWDRKPEGSDVRG
ncbi:MAG: hypothetical protein IT165_25445 [Bryobacterales bacterium]|nr:hypothetical protein [Bryobacterales bacterium]